MQTCSRVALVAAAIAVLPAKDSRAQAAAAADCVALGQPRSTTTYVYRRSDPGAAVTLYSHRWTEFSAERASVAVVRGKVNETVTNKHRIQDDVSMIAATASRTSTGSSRTDFRPALMGEPVFRACTGRTWKIKAVSATYTAGSQVSTGTTFAGTMKIVSLRDTIQVPAGRFECVRYTRTLVTPAGPSLDEYWKSIKHGVVVKQVSKVGGRASTTELTAIK